MRTMPPWSLICTGSMAVSDGGRTPVSVPPMTGAGMPLALAAGVVEVESPPQAASSEPAAVREKPKTEARTISWRRVICPFFTCSMRCCA